MKQGQITIVQGAQYGSEGKGQVAAVIAKRRGIGHAVRTGSINAGHTVLHEASGQRVKMQIIPTAWVIPGVQLYLGPGTYIHEDIFWREVEMIHQLTGENVLDRLFVDYRCSSMGSIEAKRAQLANRHHAMGATGKGCSEAVIERLRARGKVEKWGSHLFYHTQIKGNVMHTDVPAMLRDVYEKGEEILLEGTQGSLLDFNLGPWPFVTNRACNSAAWLSEAGLPSNLRQRIIFVMRTYPIRVAGNSGPMPGETSWSMLGRMWNDRMGEKGLAPLVDAATIDLFDLMLQETIEHNFPQVLSNLGDRATQFHLWTDAERTEFRECLSEAPTIAYKKTVEGSTERAKALDWMERTTVTCKIRRVADLNMMEVKRAMIWNNPDEIVLTFLNYLFPEHTNLTRDTPMEGGHLDILECIGKIEEFLGVRVSATTTGPDPEHQHEFHYGK